MILSPKASPLKTETQYQLDVYPPSGKYTYWFDHYERAQEQLDQYVVPMRKEWKLYKRQISELEFVEEGVHDPT